MRSGRSKLRLLDAAWRLFPRGVALVSLLDVAREAGLTKGGLQAHFKTKEALVEAVAARAVDSAPLPAGGAEATAWARVWMALRGAAGDDAQLSARLDSLDGDRVHASRVAALEHLLREAEDKMFAGTSPLRRSA